MNDEKFEAAMEFIGGYTTMVADLRARDTAQRKEIAELRAALATQPAAGEPKPIGYIHDRWKDNLEGVYHFTTLVRDKHKGWETPVFLDPPAAAHGDEAVRKDAEAAYVEMTCQPVLIDGATHYYLSSEKMQAFDRLFSVDVSDAAMRAQGDGGAA